MLQPLYDGLLRSAGWVWSLSFGQVALLAVLTLICIALRRRYLSSISHIPGPFVASFSRFWHVRQIIRGDQNLKLIEQHDKHGHFVRLAHNEVSVSHPSGIKQLLMAPVPKGDWYRIFCFPDHRYPAPLSLTDPKEKIERSKFLAPGFQQSNVIKYEDGINDNIYKFLGCTFKLMTGFTSGMDKFADRQEPMDLDKFFSFVAFDITGEVLFSKPFGFLDKGEDIGNAIAMNVGVEMYLALVGFFHWVHWSMANPAVTWTQLLPMGHLVDITLGAIVERQKNPDAKFDIVAHWFRGLEKAKKEGSPHFNMRHLQAAATSTVGAGSDTTSCALQSFVYYMIRHPYCWDRVRDEIDAAYQEGRCQDHVVSYQDAVQLPYLQACIKEALRLFSPVPMGLPRKVPKGGITVGDQYFAEGTTLSISPWVYHYSKEIWGPDAREFNPDRWLGPDAAEKEKFFIPWGKGYAGCPGQNIAKIQLSKITATIVRDYEIRQVDPKQEWTWAAYFAVTPENWPVYITKRTRQ